MGHLRETVIAVKLNALVPEFPLTLTQVLVLLLLNTSIVFITVHNIILLPNFLLPDPALHISVSFHCNAFMKLEVR